MINSKMYPSKMTKDEKISKASKKKKIKQLTSKRDFDINCLQKQHLKQDKRIAFLKARNKSM